MEYNHGRFFIGTYVPVLSGLVLEVKLIQHPKGIPMVILGRPISPVIRISLPSREKLFEAE